jgi:hypothetical protein
MPINATIRQELEELMKVNGEGFLFSEDGVKRPIRAEVMERQLTRALERIGIREEERRRRNLTFHAWLL